MDPHGGRMGAGWGAGIVVSAQVPSKIDFFSAFQNPHQKSEPSNVAKKCQSEPNRVPKSHLKSMKTIPGPPPKSGSDKDACIGRPKNRHLRFYVHEITISTGSKVSRNAPEMLPKCTFKCTKRSKNGFQKRSKNPSHT